MRSWRLGGFIFLLLTVSASAQVDKFKYQPAKGSIGVVYHYTKSNIDGSDPEIISVYLAAKDRVEVFKYHPENPGSQAALVIAWMDWSSFSATKLESYQVTGADQKRLVARLVYLPQEKSVNVEIFGETKMEEKTKIPFMPSHVYNFDLTSLNFAMPHLMNPEGSFQIGVTDPNFAGEGPLFLYRGEATFEFAGEENRNGVACRKYRANGPGFDNRGGTLWVSKEHSHFVDVEFDLPDNPNWKNFKLKLNRSEKMSESDWTAFYKKHFQ